LHSHSTSAEQTIALGEQLAGKISAGYPEGIVLLLVGPLGAGKTVLARGIARGLGITDQVISPTYTIVSEYHSGVRPLYHIDLYRIEGRDQMENLGLEDILRGTGVVVIEWGEKLEPFSELSDGVPSLRVTISLASDGGRDIEAREIAS
jgi:tRNA threonylcarbamoyladenosine biosynthesis protein TsaE